MVVMYRGVSYKWPYDPPEVHSLAERIAELEEKLWRTEQESEQAVNRAAEMIEHRDGRIAELEKERDIRDLKQQAMGIEDVVNECAHSMEAIQVYVADLDCRVADLREQAKALKEQGE